MPSDQNGEEAKEVPLMASDITDPKLIALIGRRAKPERSSNVAKP